MTRRKYCQSCARPDDCSDATALRVFRKLKKRERQAVILIAKGLAHKEIAERMAISIETVRKYITGVCDAAGMSTKLEIIAFLMEHPFLLKACQVTTTLEAPKKRGEL